MTAILGAGISGLSAAYYALEHPKIAPLIVFEASNRVGGWIRSKQLPDGAIFEQGPRTIRPWGDAGKNTLDLVEELDLTNNVAPLKTMHPAARNRLIYANKKLHLIPNTITSLFKKNTLLNRSFLSVVWNDIKAPKVPCEDESMYSFVERRFGKDVADYIVSPMICGICAGDAREISVKFLMNHFFEVEQKYGSITKGLLMKLFAKSEKNQKALQKDSSENVRKKPNNSLSLANKARKEKWVVWAMRNGLVQLPLALAENIRERGVQVKMEHKCERLSFKPNGVELTVNGEVQTFSRIISSLPAQCLAKLVEEQHPQLSRELSAIPTVTVAVVNLQFPKDVLSLKAFGALVSPKEEIPILGIIFDSCIISQNSTVLTVMMGGAWYEKYFGKCSTEEHFLNTAINQVQNVLHINEDPTAYNVSILKDCIPQYTVGHTERLDRICNYISAHRIPLELCGSSYQGVGVNDVILSAKQAVSNSLKY